MLILFRPFSLLPWPVAQLLWLVPEPAVHARACCVTLRLFRTRLSPAAKIAISALFVMSVTWRDLIDNGQHLLAGLFFSLLAARSPTG